MSERSAPGDEMTTAAELEQAAGMFRALGDPARLRTLLLLAPGERCVGELAAACGDALPTVSQRLKLLRSERLVRARRQGKRVYYRLADEHVACLLRDGLEHAAERRGSGGRERMSG